MTRNNLYSKSRRHWLKTTGALGLGAAVPSVAATSKSLDLAQSKPIEPSVITITHDPQLFIDDYLVDNHWGVDFKKETVTRVFHQPKKNSANPVIKGEGGYVNVIFDKESRLFRMWYQDFWVQSVEPFKYTYGVAYAESKDGINWILPKIGKFSFKDTLDNNIVLRGPTGGAAACPFILNIPKEQRRGYKYVMLCTMAPKGMHLIGSKDGINWDFASDVLITPEYGPDTQSSIVWDPRSKKYNCYTRATNIYGNEIGMRRKVASLEHTDLWSKWPVYPENIIIPDELDAKKGYWKFYGMPTRYYAGLFFGMLWPFSPVDDHVLTELAFSRDGRDFRRSVERNQFIELGQAGDWDKGMILGSPDWVEVGDEWWFYYFGSNKDHSKDSTLSNEPGIGMARLRKEGFASLRSPGGGGNIVTRLFRWPGGKLYLNADAGEKGLTVRITDYDRNPIKGFDSEPSLLVTGDKVRHEVRWKKGDVNSLKGKNVRLEIFLKGGGDIYGFQIT